MNTTTLYRNDFDFANATVDDVQFAFVVGMPFRFRIASPYHCRFENRGSQYDVWIRNKTLPTSEAGYLLHDLLSNGGTVEDLWSTSLIIPQDCEATDIEVDALRLCNGDVDKAPFESRTKQLFPSMQALNAFIVGYHSATAEMFGGQSLKLMNVHDYMRSVAWEITLVGIPHNYWTSETISELFDLKAQRAVTLGAVLHGELFDLPSEKLNGIPQAIERLSEFYFYELAFEAKAKMVSGDYIGALLLAVAALEGAHGAFVTNVLESKLPSGRTGMDRSLEEDFLKELGFSLCNRLTPYLFMEPAGRPTGELVQRAATAVKYRNEIMHALRNSTGQYRIRARTNAELSAAYSGALSLYELYRRAVENLVS